MKSNDENVFARYGCPVPTSRAHVFADVDIHVSASVLTLRVYKIIAGGADVRIGLEGELTEGCYMRDCRMNHWFRLVFHASPDRGKGNLDLCPFRIYFS